jgi:hypothetical protein
MTQNSTVRRDNRSVVRDGGPHDCLLTLRERWVLSFALLTASAMISIGERLPARPPVRVPARRT